jgi:hypothetical protein
MPRDKVRELGILKSPEWATLFVRGVCPVCSRKFRFICGAQIVGHRGTISFQHDHSIAPARCVYRMRNAGRAIEEIGELNDAIGVMAALSAAVCNCDCAPLGHRVSCPVRPGGA